MSERSDKLLPWTPRELLLAAVMLLAAVAAMWSCWCDWLNISYHIEEHSHVFLVVPFGAAIMYVNRKRFTQVKTGTSWVGPAIVAAGWVMGWYGFNYAHQSMWHMGAVLVAVGAAVSVLGHGVLLNFWPAFLLLGFMVPVPNGIRLGMATPLQTGTATVVEHIFRAFGEPVTRQGNSLLINNEPVLIAEACNGLRMVFTLILVCWLFAFVTPMKNWVRWMIILLSPITALVCNVIRLIPTVLMYGYASKKSAQAFHDYSGWAMVPIAFFVLMFVVSFIKALGFEVTTDDGDGDGNEQASEKDKVDHSIALMS
jgi:exosortase